MGLFTWIKGLLPPNDFDLDREIDREIARRQKAGFPTLDQAIAADTLRCRGSNPPAPGSKPAALSGPPPKPQPTGGRLIYTDRDPGAVPPRLPGDLAGMPSDELLDQWVQEARRVHTASGYHINASTTMA